MSIKSFESPSKKIFQMWIDLGGSEFSVLGKLSLRYSVAESLTALHGTKSPESQSPPQLG